MSKLSKSTKTIIITAAVLLVLGLVLIVLMMTAPQTEEEAPSDVTSGDTSVKVLDKNGENVLSLTVSNGTGSYTFDRQERIVTSANDGGNVTTSTEYYWTSEQMGELTPNDTTIKALMNNISGFTTRSLVEESAEDLDKYGLEQPQSAVDITFDDGSTARLLFGIRNPAADTYVYFREGDSSTVHQASYYTYNRVFYSINDYVSLILTEAYNAEDPQELDYLIIERKDFDEPVGIRFMYDILEEAEKEDSVITTFNSHRFISPVQAEVDSTNGQTVCYGLYGLTASSCEYIEADSAALAATGLDDPFCRVTFKYGGKRRVLLLGDEIVSRTETNSDEISSLSTVTGYYGMLEGEPGIYAFATDSAPWYTFTVQGIMSRRPVSPYIYTVDTLTVTVPEGEYVFEVTGDSSDHAFTYGGEALDDQNFKAFYQHLITSIGEELFFSEESYEPYIRVEFTYDEEYRDVYGTERDVIEFFESDDRKSIVSVNGMVMFKVRQIYTERLLSNLDALLNGGEVELNW